MKRFFKTCKPLSFLSLIIPVMLLVPGACKPKIVVNNANNQPATLIFGQGGGFTGKVTEYAIVSDGNLYANDLSTGERKLLKKINHKISRQFFIDAESLHLFTLQFNNPYNINYYIIYVKGPKQNKVNWGDAKNPPPAGVKELWERLWDLTK